MSVIFRTATEEENHVAEITTANFKDLFYYLNHLTTLDNEQKIKTFWGTLTILGLVNKFDQYIQNIVADRFNCWDIGTEQYKLPFDLYIEGNEKEKCIDVYSTAGDFLGKINTNQYGQPVSVEKEPPFWGQDLFCDECDKLEDRFYSSLDISKAFAIVLDTINEI